MLCRKEEGDPRRCLNEGKAVTSCALDILKKLKKHCLDDFNAYMTCLERSSGTLEFSPYVIPSLNNKKANSQVNTKTI